MDSNQSGRIEYLFYRYGDGSITKEEMDTLNSFILKSEYVQGKYFDFLKTELALRFCLQKNLYVDADFFKDK